MSNRFYQFNDNVFIEESIDIKANVCRYMNFSKLLYLLDRKFYIGLKCNFSDRRENADLYNPFLKHLTVFGEPISNELVRKREEAIKEYKDISANIYASCWNLDKNENYLMWKSYTSNDIGICIESTVEGILESLSYDEYVVYIGKMNYHSEIIHPDVISYLFHKEKYYKGENELRFYFKSKNCQYNGDDVYLECNPQLLINKIKYSPYMNSGTKKLVTNLLIHKYDYLKNRISSSKILESNNNL